MSRFLIVASCLALPVLATACGPDPGPSSPITVDAPGLDDDELWLLPGTAGLVTIYSDDPARPTWTYAASGAIEIDAAAAGELASSMAMRALAVGDGALTIRDADGVDLEVVPAHVRVPDRLLLGADAGRRELGASVVVLTGDAGQVDVNYGIEGHRLAGAGLLTTDSSVPSFRGDHDTIYVVGRETPYDVRLTGGSSAARSLRVLGIAPSNTVLTLSNHEGDIQAGGIASVTPTLTDRAGAPVLFNTTTWTRDGVTLPIVFSYFYDPAAPPSTVTVTVGAPDNTVTASIIVHVKR